MKKLKKHISGFFQLAIYDFHFRYPDPMRGSWTNTKQRQASSQTYLLTLALLKGQTEFLALKEGDSLV